MSYSAVLTYVANEKSRVRFDKIRARFTEPQNVEGDKIILSDHADELNYIRCQFNDNCHTIYKYDINLQFRSTTISELTAESLYMYDAVFRPWIISYNEKYRCLSIPFELDMVSLRQNIQSDDSVQLHCTVKRKPYFHVESADILSEVIPRDIAEDIASRNLLCTLPPTFINKVIGGLSYIHPDQHPVRNDVNSNIDYTPFYQFESQSFNIEKNNNIIVLDSVRQCCNAILFAVIGSHITPLDVITQCTLYANGMVIYEGDRDEIYIWNKVNNGIKVEDENYVGVIIFKEGVNFSRFENVYMDIRYRDHINNNLKLHVLYMSTNILRDNGDIVDNFAR